ncbi:hypothetical protein KM043_011676 [Ampulex compressa]|nr:hypothetical protein KM043_011676 [Ampulex compressa]
MVDFLSGLIVVNVEIGCTDVEAAGSKYGEQLIYISTPPCTYVRYSSLEDVKPQELGFLQLEFTPTVVSKISRKIGEDRGAGPAGGWKPQNFKSPFFKSFHSHPGSPIPHLSDGALASRDEAGIKG